MLNWVVRTMTSSIGKKTLMALTGLALIGFVIVHAAGNSNSSSADYLGSRSDVLSVAATDINGNGASFTNHGSWVDVAAPGVDILSTYRNPDDPDTTTA